MSTSRCPALPDAGDDDQRRRLVAHLGSLLGPGLAEQVVAGAVKPRNRQPPDIGDLIELVLAGAHRPLTAAEIVAHDPGGRSERYIDNVLSADERFVRLSREGFGLRSWGLPPYLGVAEAMARAIEDGRGRARLADLSADLHAQYGHSPASVSIYASSTLMFVTAGGWVRRRPPEHYIDAAVDPEDDPLCWKDQGRAVGPSPSRSTTTSFGARVLRCRRGSPASWGACRAVRLRCSTSTDSRSRHLVREGTPAPAISSLRPIADALGATAGQRLTLVG